MNKYIAMAAGMAFAFTTPVHADSVSDYLNFEIGAGVSKYSLLGDGIWIQQGMEHSLGLSAPVLSAGFTGSIWQRDSWGIDWHVDYVYLGHVSSQCECTPVDANYNLSSHTIKSPMPVPVPNANFVGNGNAQGVALTLEPYLRYHGWRIGLEGGLFPYRPAWDVSVYGWSDTPGLPTKTVQAHTPRGIRIGSLVGLSVGRGPLSVSLQYYFLPTRSDDAHPPAIWKGATVVQMRYRF